MPAWIINKTPQACKNKAFMFLSSAHLHHLKRNASHPPSPVHCHSSLSVGLQHPHFPLQVPGSIQGSPEPGTLYSSHRQRNQKMNCIPPYKALFKSCRICSG